MRLVSVLLLAFTVGSNAVAADSTPQPAQPSAPVGKPMDPSSTANPPPGAAKPAAVVAKPTSAKPVPDAKPDEKTKDGDFKPSEEISEDMAVAYPVDI
jgi:hypothetical protein